MEKEKIEIVETAINVDERHSVEISINAKGLFNGCVKCYGLTPEDAMKKTTAQAVLLEAIIKDKNKGDEK